MKIIRYLVRCDRCDWIGVIREDNPDNIEKMACPACGGESFGGWYKSKEEPKPKDDLSKLLKRYAPDDIPDDVPVIPRLPEWHYPPTDPNPVVSVCGECGLCIRRVMGYVCGNPRCPTGLGPILCSSHS